MNLRGEWREIFQLIIGPAVFFLSLLLPFDQWGLSSTSHLYLSLFLWVALQWLLTEIPMFLTGLMGVSLTVVFGIASPEEALAPFANPIIFLFLGGFLLARSLEELKFDRKLTVKLLSSRFVQGNFQRAYVSILILTAIFSMWVSNTATTAMMLPITLGLLQHRELSLKLKSTLLIALAYAATIGGLATPIGSPPNIIALGMLKEIAQIDLSFLDWSLIAFPLSFLLLLIFLRWVSKSVPKELKEQKVNLEELQKQYSGALTFSEKLVMGVFAITVIGWFLPSFMEIFAPSATITKWMGRHLHSSVVVILTTSTLFLFPLRSEKKILTGESLKSIDWGALLLFGSGLSLGKQLFETGLAGKLGDFMAQSLTPETVILSMILIIALTIFFTEFTSNTASANILVPIIIAAAQKSQLSPMAPALIVAMSCNLAFMLPVATPPNAIVYGSGLIRKKDMMSWGIKMNGLAVVLLSITFYFLF